MSKKQKIKALIIFFVVISVLLLGIILIPGKESGESVKEIMRDAVLHENNKINLFGLAEVNPAVISAFTVTGLLVVFAVIVRIFVIPKFKMVPGKFQAVLEAGVGLFDNMAKTNSPHKNGFLGAYIFIAGVYIFVGTVFELFGLQVVSTAGHSISMPAPLADINGAIAMGLMSYLVILIIGPLSGGGFKGFGSALKDFSLPISMSFRLFGALLSGALVTELVYSSASLSFGLPIFVGVMFTLLHALIQAYVLTTLVSIFYGESSEPRKKKVRVPKSNNI